MTQSKGQIPIALLVIIAVGVAILAIAAYRIVSDPEGIFSKREGPPLAQQGQQIQTPQGKTVPLPPGAPQPPRTIPSVPRQEVQPTPGPQPSPAPKPSPLPPTQPQPTPQPHIPPPTPPTPAPQPPSPTPTIPPPAPTPPPPPQTTPQPPPSPPPIVPVMIYPTDGQTLDLGGNYLFKVKSVENSAGYLFGFFQNDVLIYENLRDDGVLSANGEFAISQNNPFHSKFKKGDILVLVRALVGQQWSQAGVIMVKLISTPPTPIPILSLSYFPDQDGNEQLDPEITGMNDSISSIRIKVDQLTSQGVAILQEASAYHGYKDSATEPSLNYFVFDSREFLSPIPVSNNEIPWKPGEGIYRPDYMGMLEDINICDYVDNKGVKQVWLWSYHYGNVEPAESNMAMGNSSQAYWNHASYGDISNSEQTNDMPTCSKTYTLYNYNYARELGEMMENHGHQIEAVLKFIDLDLFWNKFVGPYGGQPGERRCGWTHYAPNGSADYDWQNENDALSDCENWTPDGIGQQVTVDCHTWHGTTCTDDGGTNFKKWWMQNIPGKNNALTYQGKNLKNWWDFLGDFDQALQNGKGLTY